MITVSPRKVSATLLSGAIFIAFFNIANDLYHQFSGGGSLRFSGLFSFAGKVTIPTWYSSSLMMLCALLLAGIAQNSRARGERYFLHWACFAIAFLAFSLDEVAAVHLRLDFMTRHLLNLGSFRYGVYLFVVAAIAGIFWGCRKFFTQLPMQTRCQLGIGWLFYIAAILIDRFDKRIWREQSFYAFAPLPELLTVVDELFELVGLVVFIYALLTYIGISFKELQIRIHPAP
jgi:uncharacterized membrane protein (UPF0136 family)